MATIEYSDDDGSSWTEIDYHGFTIERGNGLNSLAPECTILTSKDCPVSVDDLVRVKINSSRVFEGFANGNGVVQLDGSKRLVVRGYGFDVMEGRVSLDLSSTSPENVLTQAVSGTDYSISTSTSTGITLDYSCDNKKRKNVFSDMVERTGYIFRITPDKTIHFEDRGDQGSWQSLSVGTDNVVVNEWDEADADTIINKVIVNGTGEGKVSSTATDYSFTSREHSKEYNFSYITTEDEASAMADQLLQPSPLSKAKIIVAESGFSPSIYDDLVNYTITLTDSSKSISSEVLDVEKQIVMEGRVELHLGEGSSFSIHDYNRDVKSSQEKNEAGADATSENADTIVYSDTTAPPHKEGRLWFDENLYKLKRSTLGSWIVVGDETVNHLDEATFISSTAPSHKNGRLWYDTSVDKFKRSDGSSWSTVGDETAIHETFSTEGDIDVLQTTNAPDEAGADHTSWHNCQNPGDFTANNKDLWHSGESHKATAHHPNHLKGSSDDFDFEDTDVWRSNTSGQDQWIWISCHGKCGTEEKLQSDIKLRDEYNNEKSVLSQSNGHHTGGSPGILYVSNVHSFIVPAGWDYKIDVGGNATYYAYSTTGRINLKTQGD